MDDHNERRSTDANCVAFLQWSLPRLGLRWLGFRRVRRQVCRRIARRAKELCLPGLAAYRARLETHADEWRELDELCRVTISRFHRNRGVFEAMTATVLPQLAERARAAGRTNVRIWSAGCASGEEAYTSAILWDFEVAPHFPELRRRVLGTDIDPVVLARARRAEYPRSSLREVPDDWYEQAFEQVNGGLRVRDDYRRRVHFARADVRSRAPGGPFDLALCRNLAMTYFGEKLQRSVVARFAEALRPGGALVLGTHEALPSGAAGFEPRDHGIFERIAD